jgi:hypothetical protein
MPGTIFLALLLASPARAWYLESNASHTMGPDNYNASSGYIEAGQDEGFSLRPSFSTYHSLDTDPSHTAGVRLGWTSEALSLGFDASFTPPANDYQNHALGFDAVYSLNLDQGPNADEDGSARPSRGLSRLDFGFAALYTDHKEANMVAIRNLRRRIIGTRTIILDAGQYDLTGTLGARLFDFETSADITFSKYDRHIPTDETPALIAAVTRGANPTVYGFQDWVGKARLSWGRFAVFQPFGEFSYTKYKILSQYPQRIFTAGLTSAFGPVSLRGSWDLYCRGGADKRSYVSLGATFRY